MLQMYELRLGYTTGAYVYTKTGVGIKPEDLDTLFGAYTQVGSSFGQRFAGTGRECLSATNARSEDVASVGLTISKKLAKLMRGDIVWPLYNYLAAEGLVCLLRLAC